MKKKIVIPLCALALLIGVMIGVVITANGLGAWVEKYPVINCIMNLDNAMNVENNKLPFTKESLREAIQWRCAKETVDFNITDYDELFEFE